VFSTNTKLQKYAKHSAETNRPTTNDATDNTKKPQQIENYTCHCSN